MQAHCREWGLRGEKIARDEELSAYRIAQERHLDWIQSEKSYREGFKGDRRLLRNGAIGQSEAELILLLIREGQRPGESGLRSFFRSLSTGIDKSYRRVSYY